MKTWSIPVIWQEMGVIKVEADTLSDAIAIAADKDGVIPLPDNAYYVDDSWEVAYTDEHTLRDYYNNGQEDT